MLYQKKRAQIIIYISIEIVLLIVGFVLLRRVFFLRRNVLGQQHINSIHKDTVFVPADTEYQFYHEPYANVVDVQNPAWLGKTMRATIGDGGYRSRATYAIEKPVRTFRIVVIGDSFSFGLYVSDDEAYPSVLERKLRENVDCDDEYTTFEVINFGFSGYDMTYALERLRRQGISYAPDLILYLVNSWNVRNSNELKTRIEQELEEDGVPLYDEEKGYYRTVLAMEKVHERYTEEEIRIFHKESWDNVKDLIETNMIMFTLGNVSFTSEEIELLEAIGLDTHVQFVPSLVQLDDQAHFLQDWHPNASGHATIAEAVFRYVMQTTLSSCEYHDE